MVESWEEFQKQANDHWNSLSQADQHAQYQEAMRAGDRYETERMLLGTDWANFRSTEPLPPELTKPVFEFIAKHKDIIGKHVHIASNYIADVLHNRSIPIEIFQNVILFMHSKDSVAVALKIGNYEYVKDVSDLANDIISAWRTSHHSSLISQIPAHQLEMLATIAAKTSLEKVFQKAPQTIESGKIFDQQTGLVLPPEPGRPYRERGHHPDGTRFSLFEHLQQEYGPYLKAHLLYSGHLQDIDRPAYEALLYLARRDARSKKLDDDLSTTPAFFLDHGILAGEHLEFPPKHLERQVDLINKSRALTIVPKLRGRKAAGAAKTDSNQSR